MKFGSYLSWACGEKLGVVTKMRKDRSYDGQHSSSAQKAGWCSTRKAGWCSARKAGWLAWVFLVLRLFLNKYDLDKFRNYKTLPIGEALATKALEFEIL